MYVPIDIDYSYNIFFDNLVQLYTVLLFIDNFEVIINNVFLCKNEMKESKQTKELIDSIYKYILAILRKNGSYNYFIFLLRCFLN